MNQVTSSTATTPAKTTKSPPPFTVSSVRTYERYLKMLAYGKPGVGKTELMASSVDVESMRDIFMIDVEAGSMTIEESPRIKNPDLIDFAVPNNYRMFVKMYEYLSAHHRYRDILEADPKQETDNGKKAFQKLCQFEASIKGVEPEEIADSESGPKRYRTIIIDSLSEIDRMAMDNFLGAGDEPGTIDISEDVKVAEFKEYKQVNNTLNRVMRAFKYLPYHLLVVCGADYSQNELKQYVWSPSLTGKLTTQVQGYFDIVGYMQPGREGDKTVRRLWVSPEGKWDAKCRRAALREPFLDNPTMTTVMDKCGLLERRAKAA